MATAVLFKVLALEWLSIILFLSILEEDEDSNDDDEEETEEFNF